jgi:Holliday junction resolvasome RuvABC endonuclease subunit
MVENRGGAYYEGAMQFRRLIAVDPSLTCSGWALFEVSGGALCGVGKLKSLGAGVPMAARLKDLQQRIMALMERFELSTSDVLICEEQTTMRDPRAAFKVEQVRGIFEAVGRSRGLSVPGRLNPRSVQFEIMGLKGKQTKREMVKEAAVEVVRSLYGKSLLGMGFDTGATNLKRNQDIVDAILVGALGLSRIQSAVVSGEDLGTFFHKRVQTRGASGRGMRLRA